MDIKSFLSLDGPGQMAQIHQRFVEMVAAQQASVTKNQEYVVIGAGTSYTLTNTAAAVVLGTTSPVLVLPAAGTYLINSSIDLDTAGATVVAETATVKLRRTNETAADITGGSFTIDLPVMTTLTQTLGRYSLGQVVYSTLNTDDSLTIFANVSATLGAGSIKATGGRIVAVRLY